MKNNPFQRSLFLASIMTVSTLAIPIILIWAITQPVVVTGDLMRIPVFMMVFWVEISFYFAYVSVLPITQLLTKYTDDGIEQPSVFGWKLLPWADVKEIRGITTNNIILAGTEVKISINPVLFTNPQNLLNEIRSRIPESVYPSENQVNQEIIRQKRDNARRSAIITFVAGILIFILGKQLIPTMIFGFL